MKHPSLPLLTLSALICLATACGSCSEQRPGAPSDPTPSPDLGVVSDMDPGVDPGPDVDLGGAVDLGQLPDAGAGDVDQGPMFSCDWDEGYDPEVALAIDRGDASLATTDALLTGALHALTLERERFRAEREAILTAADGSALTSVTWDLTHDSAQLEATIGVNVPLLVSNANHEGAVADRTALAIMGQLHDARYVVFGASPFRNAKNAQMDTLLVNAVRWLAGDVGDEPIELVLAHLDESYYFRDETGTRTWLDEHLLDQVSYHEQDACDGAALDACATNADILFVSQHYDPESQDPAEIVAAVERAMMAGVSVIYLQHDGGINPLGRALLELMDTHYIRDNYWAKLRLTDADPTSGIGALPETLASVEETLRRVRDDDVDFQTRDIRHAAHEDETYMTQIGRGQAQAKSMLDVLDQRGVEIFATCGYDVARLLALSGDSLREGVRFPLPVETSTTRDVLRAHLADHLVYTARDVAPAQPDRGNFDPKDLSGVEGVTREIEVISREPARSVGVYVLPGQKTRITRLDDSNVTTHVYVNTLRPGATKQWEHYNRPVFLKSQPRRLEPGGEVVFTNPYGGPLQISFDNNDETVRLRVENVGEHAHWRSSADDEVFARRISEGTFGWVEVATDGFELHTRADLFEQTIQDPRWDNPAKLAEVIERYTFAAVHTLAGFSGRGIPAHPEVHGWASSVGLEVPAIDHVKHANMDQANCGYGCSGNPYDAYWAFNPIGHGDLHELGHGVERGVFKLTHGGDRVYAIHGVTNWSAFYGAGLYFDEVGGDVPDWAVNTRELFDALQQAHRTGERPGAFSSTMDAWLAARMTGGDAGISDSYAFYMQLMAIARHAGVVTNGYHLVPRLHIIERAWLDARGDDTTWLDKRASIGMGTLSAEQARGLTNNEFIAIAASFAMGIDYTDTFDMWGVAIGDDARAQIAALNLPTTDRVFFAITANDHKRGALTTGIQAVHRIPIDGVSQW